MPETENVGANGVGMKTKKERDGASKTRPKNCATLTKSIIFASFEEYFLYFIDKSQRM